MELFIKFTIKLKNPSIHKKNGPTFSPFGKLPCPHTVGRARKTCADGKEINDESIAAGILLKKSANYIKWKH